MADSDFGTKSFKMVMVGDEKSGKTSLIQRFIANQLPGDYVPTGFDRYSALYDVAGRQFSATIWDTSGSFTYDPVRPLVYKDADIVLICFNLGDWYSLYNVLHKWYPEVSKHCASTVPIVLVGCQNDQRFMESVYAPYELDNKRKVVYSEEAMEVSQQITAHSYVETCAFNPANVREMFEIAALVASGNFNPRLVESKLNSLSFGSTSTSPNSSEASDSLRKLKSSASSTLLTRHRSLFKLRKCKSKAEMKLENKKSCILM